MKVAGSETRMNDFDLTKTGHIRLPRNGIFLLRIRSA